MADLRLDAGMGQAVLDHLARFADFPADGLVAGQAVASALSELFGDGWGVAYNDVDVFRHYHKLGEDETRRKHREARRVVSTVNFTALELDTDEWNPYMFLRRVSVSQQSKYSVVKTMRDDMLNTVYYERGYAAGDESFLSTFDINAGQVGVDITSRRLMWTREFQRYLRTRQLEIVTLHTPYQSLIRYFKKREELEGTYGNDERMTEMIGLAYAIATSPANGYDLREDESLRWRFGSAVADKLDGVMSDIRPNFDIVEERVENMSLYQLVPRFEVDSGILRVARRHRDIAHLLPRLSRTLREQRRKAFSVRAEYVTTPAIELSAHPDFPDSMAQLVWLQKGDSTLECNVTVEQMQRLDAFVQQYGLGGFFIGRTMQQCLEMLERLERKVRDHGIWFYGALRVARDYEEDGDFFDPNWMDGFGEKQERLLQEHVVDRVTAFERKATLMAAVELCSRRELLEESVEMHHCVGTYSELLPTGGSRFFSVRPTASKQDWLTVHLEMQVDRQRRPLGWEISQIRGACNRKPTEAEVQYVEELAILFREAYLNQYGRRYRWLGDEKALALVQERWADRPWKHRVARVARIVAGLAPGEPVWDPTPVRKSTLRGWIFRAKQRVMSPVLKARQWWQSARDTVIEATLAEDDAQDALR
jgi:hypothetical protein